MILAVESVIICAVFTLAILPPLFKNPVSLIMSYPPAIRKRVESLSGHKNTIKSTEQKHIIKKILAVPVLGVLFAAVSHFNGTRTFFQAFITANMLFFAGNLYDLIVLDLLVFCHSKKVIIKGTEDMRDEYRNPKHHITGFIKGTGIGLIVSLLAGGIMAVYRRPG